MGVPSTLEISAKDSKGVEHLVYSETGLFSNSMMFESSRKIKKSENADTSLSFSEDGKTMTIKASGFANPNDISVVYVYVWDKRSVNNPQYILLDRSDDAKGACYTASIDISKMDRSSIRIHLYQRASGGTTKVWKAIKEG